MWALRQDFRLAKNVRSARIILKGLPSVSEPSAEWINYLKFKLQNLKRRRQLIKLVLAGPPHSGKSCLREGLKQAILGFKRESSGVPYPYVITACPDGEGAWFQETMEKYPEIAKACKAAYKGKFTQEFVRLVADHVHHCEQPLTLVDIGGRIDVSNHEICKSATHIVLLASDNPESGESWDVRLEEWREFAKELDLTVVAEIFSDYHGKADVVKDVCPNNILRGSVHHLERGERITTRPMVQALARHILALAGHHSITEQPLTDNSPESTYTITRDDDGVLHVAFGVPSANDQIVKDAVARLDAMTKADELSGGGLLKINGPASLPVAMVLGHKLSHLFEAIACFDPKLSKYVVTISHSPNPNYVVGNLID